MESTDDELRAFKPGELLGVIAYGETKTADHDASSTYRAYAFRATAGDQIELTVSAAGQVLADSIELTDAELTEAMRSATTGAP